MEAWKDTWSAVFWFASALFYGTVLVVTVKGLGDVVAMVRDMIAARKAGH